MHLIRFLAGIFVLFGLSTYSAAPSYAAACKLDGVLLDCGKGDDASKLSALAAPETAQLLSDPLASLESFERPSDLEQYRRSLESTWRAVNRTERRERRRMLRRQISASEFEKWSEEYDRALENYGAALTFYRTLVWHGKTGRAAPKDD